MATNQDFVRVNIEEEDQHSTSTFSSKQPENDSTAVASSSSEPLQWGELPSYQEVCRQGNNVAPAWHGRRDYKKSWTERHAALLMTVLAVTLFALDVWVGLSLAEPGFYAVPLLMLGFLFVFPLCVCLGHDEKRNAKKERREALSLLNIFLAVYLGFAVFGLAGKGKIF